VSVRSILVKKIPCTVITDNRGLTIRVTQINGYPGPDWSPTSDDPRPQVTDMLTTLMTYDESGRLINVQDPRFYAMAHPTPPPTPPPSPVYNYNYINSYTRLDGPAFKTVGCDAGTSWILPNVFGNPNLLLAQSFPEQPTLLMKLLRMGILKISLEVT